MRFRHAMVGAASLITADLSPVFVNALFALAAVVILAQRVPIGRALRTSPSSGVRLGVVGAALGLAGHVAIVCLAKATPLAGVSTAVVAAGLVLSVAFVVTHVLGWGEALSRLGSSTAVAAVVASTALTYATQTALELAAGDFMLVYLVLCPLGSGALLARAMRGMAARQAVVVDDDLPLKEAVRGIPWRFVLPTALLSYFEQVLSSLLFQRYPAWSRDYLFITLLCCCVVWALGCLWLASSARRAGGVAPGTSTRDGGDDTAPRSIEGSLLALFSALLVLYMATMMVTVLFPDAAVQVPVRLMVAAGSCLRTFLFCVLIWAVCEGTTTVAVGMGAFVLLSLALQVSRLTSLLFASLDARTLAELTSPQLVVPVICTMMFCVAACLVIVEGRRARRLLDLGAAGVPSHPTGDAGREAGGGRAGGPTSATGVGDEVDQGAGAALPARSYAEVARDAGLTKRETEVFELVCHGYSARAAGERLGISESTVVSHVTHIHRKFGVSSKQDLIAEVERRRTGA